MARFLLIHGTWHGAWCWERLVPILKERGHAVWAPTLIGLAERSGEASPQTGLTTHVDQITKLIQDTGLNDFTLVGHSYAGLVMVGTAERLPKNITHLVYLDSLVPDHGQSAFDLMPGAESGFVQAMRNAGSEYLVPPMPPQDLGVTKKADVKWMTTHMTPMPILTHREKVDAPQRKAFKIPSTYIHCLQFGLGAGFARQARRNGWQVLDVDDGHDVMITNPKLLADLLEQATQGST
jgi:pimeloyl-ACP methyl ester carboxylesterase